MRRVVSTVHTRLEIWFLAVFSYVPLLVVRPGELIADTKLYLAEDPAGLLSRSWLAWDSSQFGGFIPHQAIAYLWPSGPFYWICDIIGLPQWLSQRLWVGTLFFAAATGVYAFLRLLCFSQRAALTAACVFQLSPYVLAYQSRTSSMLLPWAGLGWLCYFTARGIRHKSWRWPALIALTLFTIGAVNATATLLILPAPVLVALHFLPQEKTVRTFLLFSVRTTVLTFGTSLWWIVMLGIQGRFGADLLAYSETLESVSSTANAFEVVRGMGYWLNYVDLDSLPLTTGARKILSSPVALLATTLLPLVAVFSLAVYRSIHRRLGLWLVLTGVVLAVGVFPLENPTPLFEPLASRPTSSLSLALRSSTRAIPLILLGFAIGISLFIDQWRTRKNASLQNWAITGIVVLALLAQPTKFTNGTFDPTLERTPIPASWRVLDDLFPKNSTSRILQLPGQEFGAYTWGYTADPALPAVTARGLLSRDLIPLGNESMMNLLWAIDDAAREGRLHADALETLARSLSVDTVLFPGDVNTDRYTTPTQKDVLATNALSSSVRNVAQTVDSHKYLSLTATSHEVIRQQSRTALLLGDGKGLVDASIAQAITDETVLYAGHLNNSALDEWSSRVNTVVVTDTNTSKAQHWRTSIDTLGFDENREGDLVNFTPDAGDIRMKVFPQKRSDDTTWFEQVGPVRVRASSYGPPLNFQPEHRPYAAIDSNPTTAWEVAHGVEPLAPVIALISETPISSLRLTQPQNQPNRVISRVSVSLDSGDWISYDLDDTSLSTGQELTFAQEAFTIAIRIDAVRTTRTLQATEKLSGVGFSEIATGLAPTQEVGVLPSRGLENIPNDTTLTYVMSRRVAPISRSDRTDIETRWSRSFLVPTSRNFSARVRIDTTSLSLNQVEALLTQLKNTSDFTVDGMPVIIQTRYDEKQQAIIGQSQQFTLAAGNHTVTTTSLLHPIDQVILTSEGTAARSTSLFVTDITSERTRKTATLSPCPAGCWLVFGEGHNPGWRATLGGAKLGQALIVDGGSHGWWLPPTDEKQQLTLTFTPQRTLNVALLLSALSVAVAMGVALFTRRKKTVIQHIADSREHNLRRIPSVVVCAISFGTFVALTNTITALFATACVISIAFMQRNRWVNIITFGVFATAMMSSWWEIISTRPPLNFDWTHTTDGAHTTILVTLAILAVFSLLTRPSDGQNNASKQG